MSYQVLARKWRPQRFARVVGQPHIIAVLTNSLSMGRIHHAYLFSGTRGVGKTTLARLLAKGLNCEQRISATPCGECSNCRELEAGRFVDLIEIDAASRTKVEDTRELLDNTPYAPVRGRFKIYLIDEVHMLSRHSFNALLKTLEEPPAHVKFLLATTDPQKLPDTVLSRCMQLHLKTLDSTTIMRELQQILADEKICAEEQAIALLARHAEGSMRDALSLADQAIALGNGTITRDTVLSMLGIPDEEQPLALIEALARGDGDNLLYIVDQVAKSGVDWDELLAAMLALLHRIALRQVVHQLPDSAVQHQDDRLRELARILSPEDIQIFYQTFLLGRKDLPLAPDRRTGAEMALLRALAFQPDLAPVVAHKPEQQPMSSGAASTAVLPPQSATISTTPTTLSEVNDDVTHQLLRARETLRQRREGEAKKPQPARQTAQLAGASNNVVSAAPTSTDSKSQVVAAPSTDNIVGGQSTRAVAVDHVATLTPTHLRHALEEEKNAQVMVHVAKLAAARDSWAAKVLSLTLPGRVKQLALNAWCNQTPQGVELHLRQTQRHLNTAVARKALGEALSSAMQCPVTVNVVEDSDSTKLTPLEWQQQVYQEVLAEARQAIIDDPHVQSIQRIFAATLEAESIKPIR